MIHDRFRRLKSSILVAGLSIEWDEDSSDDVLIGTVKRESRQQPFTLLLRSMGGRVLIRCVSLAARRNTLDRLSDYADVVHSLPAQISVAWDERQRRYLLAAEGEVLLGVEKSDAARAGWLIDVVTHAADRLEAHLHPDKDASLAEHRRSLREEAGRAY